MDYKTAIQQQSERKMSPERFVKITEREDQCDIPLSAWKPILENSYIQSWNGVLINKGITELGSYPMLIHELQPKTIIELGAFNGGSAIWLADLLEVFRMKGDVYAVDIDLSLLDDKARTDERIHFIQGDCNDLSIALPLELFATLPHPWLVIEDAHVNLAGVLDYFHNHGLTSGDYLIVEDTNQAMWEFWRNAGWELKDEIEQGFRKMGELREWLTTHQQEYLVDTYYQDMYGKNGSKCWNSILKRV